MGRDEGGGLRAEKVPTCPYCKDKARLMDSAAVYGGRSYGMIWRCIPCDAYVGVHKNSATHTPLGRLANKELRAWKIKAHAALDPFWRGGLMSRSSVYKRLADEMGIPPGKAHVGWFDVPECRRVVEICKAWDLPNPASSQSRQR